MNDLTIWEPDWAVSPGEVLLEALEERELSQAELARRMDRPVKTINEIVKGKAAITPETALQLERVLGINSSLWVNLESGYRLHQARQQEHVRLESDVDILKQFPVADLVKHRVIPGSTNKADLVAQLLSFLGFGSSRALERHEGPLQLALRASPSFTPHSGALTAWLRWGESRASDRELSEFNPEAFQSVLREARGWSRLTPVTSALERLQTAFAGAGVAIVFLPELKGTHLNGASYRASDGKQIIQISLRHKRDDEVWFTIYHEAAHALRTPHRLVLDGVDMTSEGVDEEEAADVFARDLLVPPAALDQWLALGKPDEKAIRDFAKAQGVAPGIVVGRLQRDGRLRRNELNFVKREVAWMDNK